jgi:hypothetical protein
MSTVTGRAVVLRFDGRFGTRDTDRLEEAVQALAPISRLILDFRQARKFDERALGRVAAVIRHLAGPTTIRLRGLSDRQRGLLLSFLGLLEPANECEAAPA